MDQDAPELGQRDTNAYARRRRSRTSRSSRHRGVSENVRDEQKMEDEPDDETGAAELDEEDRELLGEVDAGESDEDEDEDEDMGDD